MSLRVSSQQRDLLYDRVLLRLSGIDSVWQAARDGDFAKADTHAREFADMLRLVVDDLGWGVKGDHDLELRSPPDLIARVAASILRDVEAEERRVLEASRVQNQAVREICWQLVDTHPQACNLDRPKEQYSGREV